MLKIEDYRRHAEECRQLAAGIVDEDKRRMLLEMADVWDTLLKRGYWNWTVRFAFARSARPRPNNDKRSAELFQTTRCASDRTSSGDIPGPKFVSVG